MRTRVRLVASFILLIAAAPPASRHGHANPAAKAASIPVGTATPSEEPPFRSHPNPLDAGCYANPSHDRADLCAQWRAAFAAEAAARNSAWANWIAGVSTLVGIVGILGLLRTLNLTAAANTLSRRAAEAAEQTARDSRTIGEAQARCYLSIDSVLAFIGTDDGKPRLHVAIRNSGASPALETTWTAVLGYDTGPAGVRRRDDSRAAELVRVAIAPGSTFDVPAVVLDFPISSDERALLLQPDGLLQLSARIHVTATDVFERSVGTEDFFTGAIRDTNVWFALVATGTKPTRSVAPPVAALAAEKG